MCRVYYSYELFEMIFATAISIMKTESGARERKGSAQLTCL